MLTAEPDPGGVVSELRAGARRDRSPAILFGAGTSAGPPSALPTAWALFRAYRDRLAEALGDAPELADGIPPLEDWTSGVRFEQVVSIFDRIGLGLEAVAPLDASHEPNDNHRLLASLYLAGWPLMTTNFDVLTEIAILQARGELRQVADSEDIEADEDSAFRLNKLHGSFWKWRDERWLRSADSICATFDDVGGQYARYLTNDAQRLLLVRMIRERPLIVIGYSAGDDFDISPIVLHTPREQPLVWVQHGADADALVVAKSLSEVPEPARELVPTGLFGNQHRHAVTLIYGDTTAFLSRLADETGAPAIADQGAPLPESRAERALPARLLDSERQACIFAGVLLVELGKSLGGVRYMERARDGYFAEGQVEMGVFAAYEIARAYRAAGDDERAERQLETCLRFARLAGLPRWEASSLHFLGRLVARRSVVDAERCFRTALTLISRDEDEALYGSVLGNLGDVLWKRGRHDEAYELLVEAATIVESSGVLEELAPLRHRLAMWSTEAGRLGEARSFTRASLELYEKLGDLRSTVGLLHELGIIEQRGGRRAEAVRYFEDAGRLAAELGDARSDALAKYHLGLVAYQQGDIERAQVLERESSTALEALGEPYFLAHNLGLRAVLFLYHGHIDAGTRVLEEAIELSDRIGDAVHVQNCTALLRQVERAQPPEGTAFVVHASG